MGLCRNDKMAYRHPSPLPIIFYKVEEGPEKPLPLFPATPASFSENRCIFFP